MSQTDLTWKNSFLSNNLKENCCLFPRPSSFSWANPVTPAGRHSNRGEVPRWVPLDESLNSYLKSQRHKAETCGCWPFQSSLPVKGRAYPGLRLTPPAASRETGRRCCQPAIQVCPDSPGSRRAAACRTSALARRSTGVQRRPAGTQAPGAPGDSIPARRSFGSEASCFGLDGEAWSPSSFHLMAG